MSEQILKDILSELQSMKNEIGSVKNEIGSVKTGQSAMEQQLIAFQQFTMEQFSKIDERFIGLDNKITATNIVLENEIKPSIKAIAEQLDNHSKIFEYQAKQLDRIEDRVTHHDIKISILDKTKSNKRIAKAK